MCAHATRKTRTCRLALVRASRRARAASASRPPRTRVRVRYAPRALASVCSSLALWLPPLVQPALARRDRSFRLRAQALAQTHLVSRQASSTSDQRTSRSAAWPPRQTSTPGVRATSAASAPSGPGCTCFLVRPCASLNGRTYSLVIVLVEVFWRDNF